MTNNELRDLIAYDLHYKRRLSYKKIAQTLQLVGYPGRTVLDELFEGVLSTVARKELEHRVFEAYPELFTERNPAAEFGSKAHQDYYATRHGSRKTSDRASRARKAGSAALAADDPARERKAQEKAMTRILGPSGKTHAIKIIAQKKPLDLATLEHWSRQGWTLYPAATAPGQLGKLLFGTTENPTEAELQRILGPMGEARAVIVATSTAAITRAVVQDWRGMGYDVAPAPKRFREGNFPVIRNPKPRRTRRHVKKNPEYRDHATEAAIAKARDWFGLDSLLTEPELMDYQAPEAAVLIGRIVAIEYFSDKFDGKGRVYRHDFERQHDLILSVDGATMIVSPPMRVTKRGIEG